MPPQQRRRAVTSGSERKQAVYSSETNKRERARPLAIGDYGRRRRRAAAAAHAKIGDALRTAKVESTNALWLERSLT